MITAGNLLGGAEVAPHRFRFHNTEDFGFFG